MKYTERVAEYEFTSNYHSDLFLPDRKYKLKIEGRKYEPQYRTVKSGDGLPNIISSNVHMEKYFILFPSMVFSKNTINNYYFYTVFGYTDSLKVLGIPNITYGLLFGSVCLGEKSQNHFFTNNNLSLDEFIDEFWLTKFSTYNFSKKIPMYDVYEDLTFPNLWLEITKSYVGDFIKL